MYCVTFYSFKGGVGRTLALANVAYTLSQEGNSVLIVDFDLEAPGLETLPGAHSSTTGIVEYVTDYLEGDISPDVRDYVTHLTPPEGGGEIFLMPAGKTDATYAARLNAIDWNLLYKEHEGYLMFEDLKLQWQIQLEVDYVLIDSRTGHTDVGGICTRQLPDAVVVLFFPNDQNLYGLRKVVRDIREDSELRDKPIQLHFVMSNVPYLDDVEGILAARRTLFRKELDIPPGRLLNVHHYNSLDLLEQTIHTKDRPGTRLAKEYGLITDAIRTLNVEDPQGALLFLNPRGRVLVDDRERFLTPLWGEEREKFLNRLEEQHRENGEVLAALAADRSREGRVSEAKALYEAAISVGEADPELYLRLARTQQLSGDREAAASTASRVFEDPNAEVATVRGALELLRLSPDRLASVIESPGFRSHSAEARRSVANSLTYSVEEQRQAVDIFRSILREAEESEARHTRVKFELGFALIAIGSFEEAVKVLEEIMLVDEENEAAFFNLAMAHWGATGTPNVELFAKVVELDQGISDPNYAQSTALAYWFVGEKGKARELLDRAKALVTSRPTSRRFISCWRYLEIPKADFLEDIAEMECLFDGEERMPVFMH